MTRYQPPSWATALHRFAGRVMGPTADGDAPSGQSAAPRRGRRGARLNVVIDVHKAATGPFVTALMVAFGVFTTPAWIYLALHGSYGIAWVLKDVTVGDRKWRHRVGMGGVLGTWAFLSLYWVAPVILVLGTAGVLGPDGHATPGAPVLAGAIVMYAVGLALMIGADVQKNEWLGGRGAYDGDRSGSESAAGPGTSGSPGLITTGFYARTRHPNYLGEMLIYGSFALAVGHWLPWVILVAVWLLFFVPNMLAIEASLSRYPAFEAWRARTGFLLPKVWRR